MEEAEFREVLGTVRAYVREVVVPAEDVIEETDEIPETIRRGAADMGLFGYALPEEYGGLGLTTTQDARLAIELGYTTPAFRSMFGTNNGIAGQVLVNFGTDEQKRRFLPPMATGECVASFALTEPEAGSDPSGLRTRAVRDGGDYVIDGHKRFITNASSSTVLIVFARTGGPGADGISVFVVDTDTPGVTVGPRDKKMGQRGSTTAEVHFDGVRVAADRLIGGVESAGYAAAMRSLARGRVHIAACCVGMAQRLVDESVRYAASAKQGGTTLGDFQLVQGHLGESATDLYAGRALVLDAARAYDDGSDRRIAPSAAKLFCSEMLGRVADRAVQVHGGMGYMHGVPVERLYRDARLYRIYEGTSEIQKVIIARRLLAGERSARA
jgi:acyl-CoA dehydrogenase